MNRRKLIVTVIVSIFAGCGGTEEGTQTENNSPASMETDTPAPTETDSPAPTETDTPTPTETDNVGGY